MELCKKEKVDFLLAVGGGSAIDSAKAIGYGVANDGDVWDFYDYKRTAAGCLPVLGLMFGEDHDGDPDERQRCNRQVLFPKHKHFHEAEA